MLKNWYFELWYWRRLSRVPWTARRSNQSILKEISPECSLEELMLKLKLQYFDHLMWRADSFEKTLMLGKNEGRRRGQQRMRLLDGIINKMNMNLKDRKACHAAVHGVIKSRTQLRDWTATAMCVCVYVCIYIYIHLFMLTCVYMSKKKGVKDYTSGYR